MECLAGNIKGDIDCEMKIAYLAVACECLGDILLNECLISARCSKIMFDIA